ncbi:MAG: PEP-CTERM sorting domain-containing protein [Rubrivivax sp.]
MNQQLISLAALLCASLAQAAPVTMEFTASGFGTAGGGAKPYTEAITGRLSWDSINLADSISAFTDIQLTIGGHHYALSEIGIANQGGTQTAMGALARGANAVVGDGLFDDFLLVFDRVNPAIQAFAFSIKGESNAIWWSPAFTEAHFVTGPASSVPVPATALLAALGLAGVGWSRRRVRAA